MDGEMKIYRRMREIRGQVGALRARERGIASTVDACGVINEAHTLEAQVKEVWSEKYGATSYRGNDPEARSEASSEGADLIQDRDQLLAKLAQIRANAKSHLVMYDGEEPYSTTYG